MPTLGLYLLVNSLLAFSSTLLGVLMPGLQFTFLFLDKKRSPVAMFLVALAIGYAMFGAQAYIFGWLGIRQCSYLYILLMCLGVYRQRYEVRGFFRSFFKALRGLPKLFVLLIVLGVAIQSLQMVGNGLPLKSGWHFWRTNGYDGIFHIALLESMQTTFPPVEPSTVGLSVVNYHYWSDLIQSDQSRLFFINPIFLFFQWTPILLSVSTALALMCFVQELTRNESEHYQRLAIGISLLLLFIGADSGWIYPLYLHNLFTFAYPAIDNGPTQFLNMPHVFGKFFFYCVAYLFLLWRERKQSKMIFLILFLSAVTFGLKIYFAIALSLGLGLVFIFDGIQLLWKMRVRLQEATRELSVLFIAGLFFLVIVAGIYLPVNKGAGGLSWYPLEWPKLLINTYNFDWTQLNYKIALAKYLHNNLKSSYYAAILVSVGLVAIHGARAFGFLITKKTARMFRADGMLFFVLPVLICTFLGFTTLQDSGGFNVFNFFAVSLAILIVTLSLTLAQIIIGYRFFGYVLLAGIILVSLPRTAYETWTMGQRYVHEYDSVVVTPEDYAAYTYLRLDPTAAVIASAPGDMFESKSTYSTAFTGKSTFFAGKYLLETHNQPYAQKESQLRTLFAQSEIVAIRMKMQELGITHLLIHVDSAASPAEEVLLAHPELAVYSNSRVSIYDSHTL